MTDSPAREFALSLFGMGWTFTLFLLLGALLSNGQTRFVTLKPSKETR
ncbi:MAG TPA: hypothetical protein VGS22_15720 [Thermoanaerobaculia bacterium]|jgi:hypothetical protein|nr:hypothetical protein [Thermoanaerobaculia bacterium]